MLFVLSITFGEILVNTMTELKNIVELTIYDYNKRERCFQLVRMEIPTYLDQLS